MGFKAPKTEQPQEKPAPIKRASEVELREFAAKNGLPYPIESPEDRQKHIDFIKDKVTEIGRRKGSKSTAKSKPVKLSKCCSVRLIRNYKVVNSKPVLDDYFTCPSCGANEPTA